MPLLFALGEARAFRFGRWRGMCCVTSGMSCSWCRAASVAPPRLRRPHPALPFFLPLFALLRR
eukprot:12193473-Alexandrium_andersonii.AAC.1